ncbi:HAMP domain-containing sensor histidine kinase [Streptomyces sp. VRA16 Mangrove soil]|uniref:sensor histidine kinase n=1 Tax=Streptomyces sp. VRA16 Mangrove soil TaxID=2817434 RepID=UPI001E5EC0ED|nr:HAMP domain-containing sensor histidine kinase [Streptomyces sp. VRA16 Mangrove soil]
MHSLRAKLTIANVVLLALGIVAATAISLMAMKHYLLDSVDEELRMSRSSVQRTGITLKQVQALSELGLVLDKMADRGPGPAGSLVRTDSLFVAVDAHGTPVAIGDLKPTPRQRALAAAVDDPAAVARDDTVRDVTLDGDPYRMTGASLADRTTVLMATSTADLHAGIGKVLRLDLTFGAVLLLLLAVLTMIEAHRRLRPLEDMVETASAIAEGDLTRRVPTNGNPVQETEQLRLALNSMLHQVESAFETRERSAAQLRRFVADASHELRTPLSAIRGYLQLYDKGMLRAPEERARAWRRVNAEADRMQRLVDELLTLARLDQRPELRLRNVDLSRLARDAADDLRVQQPEREVTVTADGAVLVRADESGLRQVLGNLLTNVRVHTPVAAPVAVSVVREAGEVRLTVADQGPGLAEQDAARVLDRFFRAGGGAGSGLGLAIVQGVVAAHGGEVTVITKEGAGLAVTVTLPASTGASSGDGPERAGTGPDSFEQTAVPGQARTSAQTVLP